MSDMPDLSAPLGCDATRDPAAMTPEERRREIAALLARGVLRLRRCAPASPVSSPERRPEDSANIVSYSLEEGGVSRPHAPEPTGGKARQKRSMP